MWNVEITYGFRFFGRYFDLIDGVFVFCKVAYEILYIYLLFEVFKKIKYFFNFRRKFSLLLARKVGYRIFFRLLFIFV